MRKRIYVVLLMVQQCCDVRHSVHAWLLQGTIQSRRNVFYITEKMAYQQDGVDSNQLLVAANVMLQAPTGKAIADVTC